MPAPQTVAFRFSDQGLVTKVAPDLLKDGQYRAISNVEVLQEGGLASRTGRITLGQAGGVYCYGIDKLEITPGENPAIPSLNPRYMGLADASGESLSRTPDYVNFTRVLPGANTNTGSTQKGFSLSPYAPGNVGSAWAFIAAELFMAKDRGPNPYTVPVSNLAISSVTNASPCVLTLSGNHKIPTNAHVNVYLTGGVGKWAAMNAHWEATSTGATTISIALDSSSIGALTATLAECWFQPLPRWGILPAFGVALVAEDDAVVGGLNSSAPGSTAYDYRFTNVATDTNNEGNPSQTMLADDAITQTGFMGDGLDYTGIPIEIAVLGGLITGGTNANPTHLTSANHGMTGTPTITIGGATGGWAGINGVWTATVIDANTFSIPVDATGFGSFAGQTPTFTFSPSVKVLVYGTDDPQIGFINIYRRGGILFDAWRLIGQVANPGAGNQAAWIDSMSDTDLENSGAELLSIYNDPPVPSRPQTPITGSLAAISAAGRQVINVTLGGLDGVTAGSLLNFFFDNPESVIVEHVTVKTGTITAATNANPAALTSAGHGLTGTQRVTISGASGAWAPINGIFLATVTGANTFTIPVDSTTFGSFAGQTPSFIAYSGFTATFQHTHSVNADFEVDTICAQPCNLAIPFGQFQIVAGDRNNPHLLYRSTGDTPESFPPAPADGSVSVIASGNPGNPIVDLTEFRGQILTLNRFALYETLLINGSFIQPALVAYRGVVGKRAWCKRESEVWLLGVDGVYSWDGGSFLKRSEQIDNIFHSGVTVPGASLGQTLNGFLPLDQSRWDLCVLEAVKQEVHLLYVDTNGSYQRLICEPNFNNRWKPYTIANPAITQIFTEPDTGSMIEARSLILSVGFSLYDQGAVNGGVNYTSDYFTTDPTSQGQAIPFSITLPWFDLGSASSEKLLAESMLDLDVSGSGVGSSLSVDLLEDYSDTAVETLTVPLTGTGRQLMSLVAGMQNADAAKGQQARAFSYRLYGSAYPTRMLFYGIVLRFQDVGEQTGGSATDWNNLGSKYDKKLYQFTVEFDTQGTDQLIVMDTITGRDSNNYNAAVQTFRLSNPTLVSGPGSTRAMKTFPVVDGVIAKEIRLRAIPDASIGQAVPVFFRITLTDFVKEEYPPDVVAFTPRENGGSSYLKYANQIDLECDTSGVTVQVSVQADGVTLFTFPVNTTESAREANITLPPNLAGFWWRLYCDPSQSAIYGTTTDKTPTGTGKFQLFHHHFIFEPADKGAIAHTQDWQDHGYPHDKRLGQCVIEWDNTGGSDVVMQMDLLSGIDGGTIQSAVATFDLKANQGRSEKSFPLMDGLICKKTRVYPQTTPLPLGFRSWSYSVEFEKFPPDIVLFTEPKDFGYPYQKLARNLILQIDTGGVDCSIELISDANAVETFTVNTTLDDWKRFLACHTELLGRMWKLHLTPGTGGKAQLFAWDLEHIKIPAAVALWASYEQAFGYAGWKFVKQIWLQYQSPTPICYTLMTETGSYTWTLPAHLSRTPERFYVSSVLGNGLNKSRIYTVSIKTIDGQPFTFYPDASWIEWLACGADQHAGYQKAMFSEMNQIPI